MNNPFITNGYVSPGAISSVRGRVNISGKAILDKFKGVHQVYDRFFLLWLRKNKI